MHHPTDRITHTIAFDTPVVEHIWNGEFNGSNTGECNVHGKEKNGIQLKQDMTEW